MNIAILGSGTFGTSLAMLLDRNNHKVTLWSKLPKEINYLKKYHKHAKLPGARLSSRVKLTLDIEEACKNKDIILFSVSSSYIRDIARLSLPYIKNNTIIINTAKGIEEKTYYTMTDVINDEARKIHRKYKYLTLAGPSHAEEIARDLPTTIVAAGKDKKTRLLVQKVFMNENFRVYTNNDIKGCEVCSTFKNILALACGISDGMGFGDNIKAAIMVRGMMEMQGLGMRLGCNKKTFYGLAGIGDVIVTSISVHSRNNTCGRYIGSGLDIDKAIKKVGMVVEGINAIKPCVDLMKKYKISMPITEGMYKVVYKNVDRKKVIHDIMMRKGKEE